MMQSTMRRKRRLRKRNRIRMFPVLLAVVLVLGFVWNVRGIAYRFYAKIAGPSDLVFTGTIGEIEKGKIPLLLQGDTRWGRARYGDSDILESGCAPTALSMVAAGLTGDNTISPYSVAKFAEEQGYYVPGTGTSWSLMTEGCRNFGVMGTEISLTEDAVLNTLRNGSPVICSVGPGDFTTKGHFIVLTGVEDGKIRVNDPNSEKNSKKLWDYDTLEPQIKNLWSFQEK